MTSARNTSPGSTGDVGLALDPEHRPAGYGYGLSQGTAGGHNPAPTALATPPNHAQPKEH